MSVIAGVAKAAGAKVLTRTRPTTRVLPRTVRTFVMIALALLGLVAFAASQGTNAEHSSVASTDYQSETAPVSGPAASQMSEQEALDAYGKLALSFVPNEGQTEEAVRYCAQGAGYGFYFTKEGAMLSFSEAKGTVATRWHWTSWVPTPTRRSKPSGFQGRSTTYKGTNLASGSRGYQPTQSSLRGLWSGIDMAVRGEGASSSTSSTSSQALLLRMSDWPTAGPKAQGRGW